MPRVKQPHRLFLMETSFQTAQSASFYRSVSCPWKSTKEAPLRILCVYVHVCVCVWFTAPPISTYMYTHIHTHSISRKQRQTEQPGAPLDSGDTHSVLPGSPANSTSALCPRDLSFGWGPVFDARKMGEKKKKRGKGPDQLQVTDPVPRPRGQERNADANIWRAQGHPANPRTQNKGLHLCGASKPPPCKLPPWASGPPNP